MPEKKIAKLASLMSAVLLFAPLNAQAETWDGRYFANIAFNMSPSSVCPAVLPLTIEIQVAGDKVSGVIMNDGGENTHKFCALYHNGEITGNINQSGDFVKVKIKQQDRHSRKYSSNRITGKINGTLTLLSADKSFHPNADFSLKKRK